MRGSIPKEKGQVGMTTNSRVASIPITNPTQKSCDNDDNVVDIQATEQTILDSLPTRKLAIIAVATAAVGYDHDGTDDTKNIHYDVNYEWPSNDETGQFCSCYCQDRSHYILIFYVAVLVILLDF